MALHVAQQHGLHLGYRRLAREVRESPLTGESPIAQVQVMLLGHVQRHSGATSVAERAQMLGVSIPTYHKRLKSEAGE